MSQRIAICGAHGVGKTTLAKALSEYTHLPILPDVAALAYHRGMPVNEQTTLWSLLWMIGEHTFLESQQVKGFIADKCIWDYYVYGTVILGNKYERIIRELSHPKLKRYDLVFYIRPEFNIEADGRSTDPTFQKLIDSEYLNLLKKNNVNFHILSGSVKDRLQHALEIINSTTKDIKI